MKKTVLAVLLLGRVALWSTVLPVLLGVVFFIIKAMGFESWLHMVLCILLYLLVAVLYTGTVFGLIQTNSCGVIDETYCGDNDQWFMPVLAMRDTKISLNDRICQFRIFEHQPFIEFEETERLSGKDRGGFGSTGKN